MQPLDDAANRQAIFSQTSDALKKNVDLIRTCVLVLSVGGAAAAGVAAALNQDGTARTVLTLAGAVLLFLASGLTAFFLGAEARQRPVRFRAGSETLKREIYLYAAGAGSYDGADRDERLNAAVDRVDKELEDLNGQIVSLKGEGSCPRQPFNNIEEYRAKRLEGQIDFYTSRSARYARRAKTYHIAAWLFSLGAGLITLLSAQLGSTGFDYAAITGILTTVGAALLTHLQASKYDQLVVSYRSARRALERLQARIGPQDTLASIAERTEAILAEETGSWRSMFLEDSAPARP